ncbi:hypothetical protein ABVT39_005425 [Epinephelus coioides]
MAPDLFKSIHGIDGEAIESSQNAAEDVEELVQEGAQYRPEDPVLSQMVRCIFRKKIPANLPPELLQSKREFPQHLIPTETICTECAGQTPLGKPQLITSKAKIVTVTDTIEGRFQLCNEDCGGMKHMLHTSAGSSVTDLHGKDVFAVDGYVISTWKQPFTMIPILSLPNIPAQGASADCGVLMLMATQERGKEGSCGEFTQMILTRAFAQSFAKCVQAFLSKDSLIGVTEKFSQMVMFCFA